MGGLPGLPMFVYISRLLTAVPEPLPAFPASTAALLQPSPAAAQPSPALLERPRSCFHGTNGLSLGGTCRMFTGSRLGRVLITYPSPVLGNLAAALSYVVGREVPDSGQGTWELAAGRACLSQGSAL